MIANGTVLEAKNEINSDLYWALRGGGGGTFGILLNLTLNVTKMSKSEWDGITQLSIKYPFYIDSDTNNDNEINESIIVDDILFQYFNTCIPRFSNKVNGFMFLELIGVNLDENKKHIFETNLAFRLVYIGNINDAEKELECIAQFYQEYQKSIEYTFHESFWAWELENGAKDQSNKNELHFSALYSETTISNPKWIDNYVNNMINFINDLKNIPNQVNVTESSYYYVFVAGHLLLGHNVTRNNGINDTSITPGFRNARIYVESTIEYEYVGINSNSGVNSSIEWQLYKHFDDYMNKYRKIFQSGKSSDISDISDTSDISDDVGMESLGAYFNENYHNNSNFANDYWSMNHYTKLQTIKEKYDPKPSLFNCRQCVTLN